MKVSLGTYALLLIVTFAATAVFRFHYHPLRIRKQNVAMQSEQAIALEHVVSAFDLLVCFSASCQTKTEREKLQSLDLHCPLLSAEAVAGKYPGGLLETMTSNVPRHVADEFHAYLVRSQLSYNVLLHASASMNFKTSLHRDLWQAWCDALATPLSFGTFVELRAFLRGFLPYVKQPTDFYGQAVPPKIDKRRRAHMSNSVYAISRLLGEPMPSTLTRLRVLYSEFLPQGAGLGFDKGEEYIIIVHSSLSSGREDEERNVVTHEAFHYVLNPLWKSNVRTKQAIASSKHQFKKLRLSPLMRSMYGDWSTYLQEIIIRAAVPHLNKETPFSEMLPLEDCWRHFFQQISHEPVDLADAIDEVCGKLGNFHDNCKSF